MKKTISLLLVAIAISFTGATQSGGQILLGITEKGDTDFVRDIISIKAIESQHSILPGQLYLLHRPGSSLLLKTDQSKKWNLFNLYQYVSTKNYYVTNIDGTIRDVEPIEESQSLFSYSTLIFYILLFLLAFWGVGIHIRYLSVEKGLSILVLMILITLLGYINNVFYFIPICTVAIIVLVYLFNQDEKDIIANFSVLLRRSTLLLLIGSIIVRIVNWRYWSEYCVWEYIIVRIGIWLREKYDIYRNNRLRSTPIEVISI